MDYRSAGVDLQTYEETISRLPPLLRRTYTPRVIAWKDGFAGLFRLDDQIGLLSRTYRDPVLVASTDGVGTKLKLAFATGRHTTVGIDLVAMSVNDCLCTGGEPLMFLDYLAMPKDDPALTRDLIKGVSDGCIEADCALVGGETAILPDFYAPGDYDMAGFCVGVVEREHIVNGRTIRPGDVVLGLASSGLHSNGYSLVRKVVFEHAAVRAVDPYDDDSLDDALADPIVIDVVLHENGWFDRFLADRGPLLPDDEALLARAWTLVQRSAYEVVESRPGTGITMRDLRTGDVLEVRERSFSREARRGALVCARAVPDGQ